METKSENAIKWINELLTTNQKQGKGSLGDEERGYCCLGLGCNLLRIDYDSEDFSDINFKYEVGLLDLNGAPITRYFKVDTSEQKFLEELVELNDDIGLSFEQIGSHLLQYPEYYFEQKVAEDIKKELKPNEVTV